MKFFSINPAVRDELASTLDLLAPVAGAGKTS
jgi:hypothetical protein